MAKFSDRRDDIAKLLEIVKEDLWGLLDDMDETWQACPYDTKMRDTMNSLLDYIDSMEFDSELNPDGN